MDQSLSSSRSNSSSSVLRNRAVAGAIVGMVLAVALLYALSRSNYLLFHVLVEGFSIVVGFATFVVAWNTRKWVSNDYLLFLGVAFLFVASVDLVHTLAYAGMGVFPGLGSNQATQLWVLARYIQAVVFLAAPLFLTHKLKLAPAAGLLAIVTGLGLASIMWFRAFPVSYVEGHGLTTFKVASEYVIAAIVVGAIVLLSRVRDKLDPQVFTLLIAAMGTTIAAEMSFTLYTDVYGFANVVGHLFKAVSFLLVYQAVVVATLSTPYRTLFRDLAQSRDQVQRERDLARNYVDTARVILLVLDREGIVRLINRKGVEVLGYPEEEILGKDWFQCFLPVSQREEIWGAFSTLIEGVSGVAEYVESSLVDVHGDEHVISWHNTVLRDESGAVTGTLSSGEDITERKRTELALQASEEKFRALFERSIDAIFIYALDGAESEANQAWLDLFGYTKDELPSIDPTRDLYVDPRDRKDFARRVGLMGVVADEVNLKKKDGTPMYCQRTAVARRDAEGCIISIQSIIRDMTARRRVEERIRRSEEQYRALFEQSRDAIYLIEPGGALLNMNEAAVRLFGYSRDRLLSMNIADLCADPASCPRLLARVHAEGGLQDHPLQFRRKDGTILDCQIMATIISGHEGSEVSYQMLVRDVTVRKRLEDANPRQ